MTIYLDYSASAPIPPLVREKIVELLQKPHGNPSSVHGLGRRSRTIVESARQELASMIGAEPSKIVFTSGGTESNQHAHQENCVVSPTVHSSLRYINHPTWLPVMPNGAIDYDRAETLIRDQKPQWLVVELVNHETGVIHDVPRLASWTHAVGGRVHCDAVAALGKVDIDVEALGVDSLAVSGHKIGAPSGVGAVYTKDSQLAPIFSGGSQERERRPGTENVVGIAGFGAAVQWVQNQDNQRVSSLLGQFEAQILSISGAAINGGDTPRCGFVSNVSFSGCEGQVIATALDLQKVCCSTGSACSSGTKKPSPVLLAMGRERKEALSSVRFSLGWGTTEEEINHVTSILPEIVARARRFG